jgi:2-haloacid dehalogenase
MEESRRGTVAFDVIGTLFTLERPRAELVALGAPATALEIWFAESLRDFFALSHSGSYAPLRDVLGASLPRTLEALQVDHEEAAIQRVMSTMRELDPAEGAGASIQALTEAGFGIVALTNGSEELTKGLLEGGGLYGFFDGILSCDEIKVSKPHPEVYEMARRREPGELWMVAGHSWDVAGAARAGLKTAWISAKERIYPATFPSADVVAPNLESAASSIIAHRAP